MCVDLSPSFCYAGYDGTTICMYGSSREFVAFEFVGDSFNKSFELGSGMDFYSTTVVVFLNNVKLI